MPVQGKTFGEFFDEVAQTKIVEGQIWLEDWQGLVDEARWQEVRAMPLTDELVAAFTEDMVTAFQERMRGICTDALYTSTLRRGHAFLEEIGHHSTEFGVDVSRITQTPITPTEAVARYAAKLRS